MENILSNMEQNEDNQNINNIINNYKILLVNQNNKFTFKVSEIPFNELYSFLKNVLEPPILKIKNEYNLIEEKILGKILTIIDTFPDFQKVIKEKLLIENTLEYIKFIFEKTRDSLLKYQEDLNDDYDSYINKLIHYTYINGLDSYDKPCNYSYCSIDVNKIKNKQRRRLQSFRGTKKFKIKKKNKHNRLNLTKINEKRNKNIDFKRRLTSFDSKMGSLSKDDVIPLLLDIKDTIYDLNQTYINNFDINAKKKTEHYISKINGTYMIKLNRTIATSTSKFSPILSKDCFQKLLDNMYKEYYKLEKYFANITKYLQEDVDELIMKLKNTSYYIREINDISYNKMIGYLNILTEVINSKYEMMSNNNNENNDDDDEDDEDDDDEDDDDELEGPNEINEEDMKKFKKKYKNAKENNDILFAETLEITEDFNFKTEGFLKDLFTDKKEDNKKNDKKEDDDDVDIESELSLVLDKNGFKSLSYQLAKEINLLEISLPIPPFIMFFVPFPILQMRIVPEVMFSLNFRVGAEINFLEKELSVFFDISANAEVSVSLEVGCYIPPFPVGVEIALSVGIKGLLGSGTIGIKLSLFVCEPKFEINLYMEFKSMEFTFYILFKVKFDLGILSFSFRFYLMNEKLFDGFGYKKTKKLSYKLPNISNY